MSDEDFKVIKVERFDTKGIRHAFDDVGRQTFNNRVKTPLNTTRLYRFVLVERTRMSQAC